MSSMLLEGKRGLVMGVANDHSIAWGIARNLAKHGAELAFSYQGEILGRRVRPLSEKVGARLCFPCDVEDPESVDQLFKQIQGEWGELDFVIHAIAYSDRNELKGRFIDVSRDNFVRTMLISCFSFTEVARRASALMPRGGALITLTFEGSTRVIPNYNIMGLAKSALESSVRYLAVDLGPQAIRVNAISPGPARTLAGAGIVDARYMFHYQNQHSPLGRGVTLDEIGGCALYLVSDLSTGVSGNIHFVNAGYNVVCVPRVEELKKMALSARSENGAAP